MDLIAVLLIGIIDQIIFCPDKAEEFSAVLGNGFDPLDLVAYAAGIALGLAVDLGWERVRLDRG